MSSSKIVKETGPIIPSTLRIPVRRSKRWEFGSTNTDRAAVSSLSVLLHFTSNFARSSCRMFTPTCFSLDIMSSFVRARILLTYNRVHWLGCKRAHSGSRVSSQVLYFIQKRSYLLFHEPFPSLQVYLDQRVF